MDTPQPDNPTFEQALADLDAIVHDLEEGSIGLEASLARYEQGVALLKKCYAQLRDAEQRILLLTGVDEEGNPSLQPFQPGSATADGAPTLAPARRTRKRPDEPRGSAY